MVTRTGTTGNDVFVVEDPNDVILEAANGGFDIVYATVNYTLTAGSYIELLATGDRSGTAPLRLTGNELDNILNGNAGNNTLNGGGGRDALYGFRGDDTYIVDANTSVFEAAGEGYDTVLAVTDHTLTMGSSIELLATGDRAGTAALRLTGNELDNTIIGNAGNNTLNGGGGRDTLFGLGGNDVYIVDSNTAIGEAAGEGFDIAFAVSDYTLTSGASVELLATGNRAGTAPLRLTGNGLANTVQGNAGNNTLNGGGGNDQLFGFGGDDVYIVDANTTVGEAANEGFDIVYTTSSYALAAGASIELLATGDRAGANGYSLTGNEFAQTVQGNNGDNTINGGAGSDTLFGFGGRDTFAFDTALGANNVDTIGDFDTTQDTVLLNPRVFTGLPVGQLAASSFVRGTAAGDADDRVIYDSATGALFFDADGTGSTAAVQFANIGANLTNLSAANFTVGSTNAPPVAVNDTNSLALSGSASSVGGNVLTNDSDPAAMTALTVSAVRGSAGNVGTSVIGTYGSINVAANGTYTYTVNRSDPDTLALNSTQTGTDQFSYTITNAEGGTATASVAVSISGQNDAPRAINDGNIIDARQTISQVSGNVLANDSDPDSGAMLSVNSFTRFSSGNQLGTPLTGFFGALQINADGSYTYTLDKASSFTVQLGAGATEVDSYYNYLISDGQGGTSSATFTIQVIGRNDAPDAVDDLISTTEGSAANGLSGTLFGNDRDPDTRPTQDPIFLSTVNGTTVTDSGTTTIQGTYGFLSVRGGTGGEYSYTLTNRAALSAGQTGTETFNYTIRDGGGLTDAAKLQFTITGTDEPQTAVGSEFLVNTQTAGAQTAPSVAAIATGGYVVTWVSAENAGDIRAQIFNADGSKAGAEFLVNANVAGAQSGASVTALDTGGFAIGWKSDGDVRAQAFTDAGTKVGMEFSQTVTVGTGIPTEANRDARALSDVSPVISDLAGSGYVLGWSVENRMLNSNPDGTTAVYYQTYDVQTEVISDLGTASGGVVTVGQFFNNKSGSQFDLTGLSSGSYAVAAGDSDIKVGSLTQVRIFDQSGNKVGSDIIRDYGSAPAVAAVAGGGFVVTGGAKGSSSVRAFDNIGTYLGQGATSSSVSDAQLASAGSRALEVFTGSEQALGAAAGNGIRAQLYDKFGTPVGDFFNVNTTTAGDQLASDVAFLSDGRAVVVYQDNSGTGADASGSGIKAQVFSFNAGQSGAGSLFAADDTVSVQHGDMAVFADTADAGVASAAHLSPFDGVVLQNDYARVLFLPEYAAPADFVMM